MTPEITRYVVRPTREFPVHIGLNYVVDLPEGEIWSKTATVRFDDSRLRLKEGDMLRLPSGSWLEVMNISQCFGTDSLLYGDLEVLSRSDEIEKKVGEKRKEGRVYKTEATYIS